MYPQFNAEECFKSNPNLLLIPIHGKMTYTFAYTPGMKPFTLPKAIGDYNRPITDIFVVKYYDAQQPGWPIVASYTFKRENNRFVLSEISPPNETVSNEEILRLTPIVEEGAQEPPAKKPKVSESTTEASGTMAQNMHGPQLASKMVEKVSNGSPIAKNDKNVECTTSNTDESNKECDGDEKVLPMDSNQELVSHKMSESNDGNPNYPDHHFKTVTMRMPQQSLCVRDPPLGPKNLTMHQLLGVEDSLYIMIAKFEKEPSDEVLSPIKLTLIVPTDEGEDEDDNEGYNETSDSDEDETQGEALSMASNQELDSNENIENNNPESPVDQFDTFKMRIPLSEANGTVRPLGPKNIRLHELLGDKDSLHTMIATFDLEKDPSDEIFTPIHLVFIPPTEQHVHTNDNDGSNETPASDETHTQGAALCPRPEIAEGVAEPPAKKLKLSESETPHAENEKEPEFKSNVNKSESDGIPPAKNEAANHNETVIQEKEFKSEGGYEYLKEDNYLFMICEKCELVFYSEHAAKEHEPLCNMMNGFQY